MIMGNASDILGIPQSPYLRDSGMIWDPMSSGMNFALHQKNQDMKCRPPMKQESRTSLPRVTDLSE